MRLKGEDGTSFELKIEGYQFPEIQDDRWDSNWLVVSGQVAHPRGDWTFRNPCLTTFEIEQLARWFDTVAVGKPKSAEGYFTEPNLEFRYVKGPAAVDVRKLSMTLRHQFAAFTVAPLGLRWGWAD